MACDQEFAGYSEVNKDTNYTVDAVDEAFGQAFTLAGAHTLCACKFHCRYDFGAGETSTIVARLYAATGTVGTNATPTGAVLATSDAINLTDADNDANYVMRTFTFSTPYAMTAGDYVIVVACTAHGGASADVKVGADQSTPSHSGNAVTYYTSWAAVSQRDVCFSVLEVPTPPTEGVGGGMGAKLIAGGLI